MNHALRNRNKRRLRHRKTNRTVWARKLDNRIIKGQGPKTTPETFRFLESIAGERSERWLKKKFPNQKKRESAQNEARRFHARSINPESDIIGTIDCITARLSSPITFGSINPPERT
jgi:hypothetical protein